MYIYKYTSTHRGKRHKVAGTKRRDDRFSFLLDRSPHCRSSRLDRCEFKAFHAITHIGQFAYGICLSTHWTVNRMTYSAIRRHVIIHRGTCFFFSRFHWPGSTCRQLIHRDACPIDRSKLSVKLNYIRMFFQTFPWKFVRVEQLFVNRETNLESFVNIRVKNSERSTTIILPTTPSNPLRHETNREPLLRLVHATSNKQIQFDQPAQ